MIERVERFVLASRQELELRGFPKPGDLVRLADSLQPLLRWERGPSSECLHDGVGAVLIVNRRFVGRRFEVELGHELAHALFTCGLAYVVRDIDWSCPRIQRLADNTEARDEGIAHQFTLAWFLPAPLVVEYWERPRQLARDSGCSLAWVNQRRVELWGIAQGIEPLPEWLEAT